MEETLHTHGPVGHQQAAPPDPLRWRALAVLVLAQFMLVVDVTVVNVALPSIAHDLDLGRGGQTWVVTAYALCFGGLLLLGGRMADAFGRRRVFLTGLILFTMSSLVSGLAWNGGTLIGGRIAQGVGAAMLSPSALSIVTTTFHGNERNRALGVWAAVGGSGAAVGVLLGGLLTSGPGWEWIFFVNVPVGVIVLAAVPRLVPAVAPIGRTLDVPGALAATATAALLIYGLVKAGEHGWGDASTLVPLGLSLAAAVVFVLIERTVRTPLLPLGMLRRRSIAAGNLVMLSATGLLVSSFFLSSQYLQNVLAYSAVRTGLVFLPVAVATVVGAHLGSHVIGHAGARPVATAGLGLAALGLVLLHGLPAGGDAPTDLLPGFLILAVGLGATFVCATTTAMRGIEHREAGLASGIVNTGHEIGAALGVAFATAMAGASIGGHTVGGFATAFGAFSVAAAVLAVLASALIPGGRPDPHDGPVFAH